MKLKEWIVPSIPILAVIITYFLGRLQSYNSFKNQKLEEGYNSFYVPFIERLNASKFWENDYSYTSDKSRFIYFDLVMKNLKYMNHETLQSTVDFYESYLEYENFLRGTSENPKISDKVNEDFIQLTICILREAQKISLKLSLPNIAGFFLKFYA